MTFQDNIRDLLDHFYHEKRRESHEEEKLRIVNLAAQIIKQDIIKLGCKIMDMYPNVDELEIDSLLGHLPESLRSLLIKVIGKKEEYKVAAIGQSIMQSAKNTALMMPFSLYLGVHLHNRFGSRYLIDKLSQFGFCSGYKEVLRFEKNAAVTSETLDPGDLIVSPEKSVEFVADNVDDDPANLDGLNTIHIMGIIAGISPPSEVSKRNIPRNDITNNQIKELSSNIIYKFDTEGAKRLGGLKFQSYQLPICHDKYSNLDIYYGSANNTWQLIFLFGQV